MEGRYFTAGAWCKPRLGAVRWAGENAAQVEATHLQENQSAMREKKEKTETLRSEI
jgi:hypothetical protein